MADVFNRVSGTVHGSVVQIGSVDRLVLPTQPPEVLGGLPAQQGPFVGRQSQVESLLDELRPRWTLGRYGYQISAASRQVLISGPPGVGKTSLALRVAESALAKGWYQGVLFVDLRGAESEEQLDAHAVLGTFLRALGIERHNIPLDGDERASWFRSQLSSRPRRLLLILDNAASAEQIDPLMPGGRGHAVIVTSRQTLAESASTRRLTLDMLTTDEALDVLKARVDAPIPGDRRIAAEPKAARQIVRLCGRHPLALSIAAANLVDDARLSTSELAARLHDAPNIVEALRYKNRSVGAALTTSYRALDEDDQRLFRLLSLHPGPHITDEAVRELDGRPADAVSRSLDTLRRASLIRPTGPPPATALHDVVRWFSHLCLRRDESEHAREEALTRLLTHYEQLTREADDRLLGRSGPNRFPSQEAALRWLDRERLCLIGVLDAGHQTGLHAQVIPLARRLYRFFELRCRWDDLRYTHARALDSARHVVDRATEAELLVNLGEAYRKQLVFGSEFARRATIALAYYQKAADVFLDLDDRDGLIDVIDRVMSIAARWHGRYANLAVEHYEQAVRGYRQAGDDVRLARALNNLGVLHLSHGAVSYTVACLQEACVIAHTDREKAQALINLGNAYRRRREHDMAVYCYRKAHEKFQRSYDVDGECAALYNMGLVRLDTGRVGKARQSWRALQRVKGPLLVSNARYDLLRARYVRRWQNRRFASYAHPREFLALAPAVASIAWYEETRDVPDFYDSEHAMVEVAVGDIADPYPDLGIEATGTEVTGIDVTGTDTPEPHGHHHRDHSDYSSSSDSDSSSADYDPY